MRTHILVLLAAPILLSVGPGLAMAGPPTGADFGDTLTANTKLTSDLSGSGTGLIVGADGITIDLNGHSLTMTGGNGIGIDNSGGWDDVTIKNGTIEGFDEGVRAEDVDGLKLRDLDVIGASGHASVTGAIHVLDSEDVSIKNSTVTVTAAFLGPHAIRFDSVEDVRVQNVDIDGGFIGVSFFSVGGVGDPTTGSVQDCTMTGCFSSGVLLASTDDARIQNNEMSGGSVGMQIGFAQPVSNIHIAGNSMHDNGGGMQFRSTSDSKITDNEVTDNGAFGIVLNGSSDNKVSGNLVADNGLRGIVLVNGANDNRISDNAVLDNGLEGITLFVGTNTGNRITGNTSLGNGVWDLFHNGVSTPNFWNDNDYDTKLGADIP